MKDEAIKQAEKNIERAEKALANVIANVVELERVSIYLQPLQPFLIAVTLDGVASIDLNYSGDRHVLDGIFAAMRKAGYEPTARPTETNITHFATYWTREGSDPYGSDRTDLRFWISFASTKCRRVQVGVKMIEQPVYENVCD